MDEAALLRLARLLRDTGYAFVTPTPASHARVNARPGNERATDLRSVFGWSRPFEAGAVSPEILAALQAAGALVKAGPGAWRSAVRAATLDGMLLLHSAYPTDAPDAVFLGPDTYRYATALTDWLDRGEPVSRAVDIGCGSGAAALVIKARRPDAEVFGVDINAAALALTRVNAALAGLDVQARHSDLLDGVPGQFDLIVANPPYLVDPAARQYRHGGGPLGAALSLAILRTALTRLAPGGTLLLYTGSAIVDGRDAFRDAAAAMLADRAWRYREVDPDVFGEELAAGHYVVADRIAAVVLTTKQ